VRRPDELLSVEIHPTVRVIHNGHGFPITEHELGLMTRWVELNREVLLRNWSGETDSGDIIEALKSVTA
jgi:hypothetical protein